jgi:branched-chain amino acid transport system permease protein
VNRTRGVELAAAAAGPIVVFLLVVGAVAIDQPVAFLVYAVVVGAVLVAVSRLGVAGYVRESGRRWRVVSAGAGVLLVLAFPLTQLRDPFWIRVAVFGAISAALALGLNIVVGRAGLLDLGYAAFFGIGAYSGALLADCARCPVSRHLPWLVALLVSAVVGAAFGVILGFPVLRLRGDYLAIVTLGFGEIVRTALNNLDNVPFLGTNLTNGPNGLFGVGHPSIGSFDFAKPVSILGVEVPNVIRYYYVEVLFTLLIVFVVRRMDSSRIGRAWTAIREDEVAAQAIGINLTRTKLLAFASGAFFGGIAGNIFVHLQAGTSPEDFGFLQSVTFLAMVILGGMGNPTGVVIASILLVAIPEKLRFVADYRFLIFGLVLILMMRFRPQGLVPEERRQLELEEAMDAEATP